jgi:hypothetical protein
MSESRLPSSFQVCATCAYWGGTRTTDGLRYFSIFEQNQRGECCGGGFNHAPMVPIATCNQWTKWQVLKS